MRISHSLMIAFSFCSAMGLAQNAQSYTFAGHSLDSFGRLNEVSDAHGGGAAWSADGQQVFTLDSTGSLRRWAVTSGTLLEQRIQAAPGQFSKSALLPILTLDGWQGNRLKMRAYSTVLGSKITQDFAVNPAGGELVAFSSCPSSRSNLKVCLGKVTAYKDQANNVFLQSGTEKLTLPVPKQFKVNTLALSPAGQVAALALQPVTASGQGSATLLIWQGKNLKTVPLGNMAMNPTQARLVWSNQGWLYALSRSDLSRDPNRLNGQVLGLVKGSGEPGWTLASTQGLRGIWPSPEGKSFVTFSDASVPELRRVSDGAFVRGLGEAVSFALPVNTQQTLVALFSGGGQGRIVLGSRQGFKTISPVKADVLAVSQDGRQFLSSLGNVVRLHDISGQVRQTVQHRPDAEVRALAFRSDGNGFTAQDRYLHDMAWDWQGKPIEVPETAAFPQSLPLLTMEVRADFPDQHGRTRYMLEEAGKTVWQTPWWLKPDSRVSADGRWLALAVPTAPAQRQSVPVDIFRLNSRTGQKGSVLRARMTSPDRNATWEFADVSQDGRFALLREHTWGDCGWNLFGFKVADLSTGKERVTSEKFQKGYRRMFGCGVNHPWVHAHFASQSMVLVQDGNRLDWWNLP